MIFSVVGSTRSGLLLVLAAAAAAAGALADTAGTSHSTPGDTPGYQQHHNDTLSAFCQNITHGMNIRKNQIGRNGSKLSIMGVEYDIVFSWSSEAERAVSALLALAWRCAGYRRVFVDPHRASHSLAERHQRDRVSVGLSARFVLGESRPPALDVLGPGAVPNTPRLHVRLAPLARDLPNCILAYYISSFYFDEDKLRNCLFLIRHNKPTIYILKEWNTITDRNSSAYSESPAILEFSVKNNMSEKYISRLELKELFVQVRNESFLFVDAELWRNVEDVALFAGIDPPPFGIYNSVRFVHGDLRRYAPSLLNATQYFSPRTSDLREMLALDMTDPLQAASIWTLQRSDHRDRLRSWLNASVKPIKHYIDVVLCNDLNKTVYDNLLRAIYKETNKLIKKINFIGIELQSYYVDCSSATSGSKRISDSSKERKNPRLIGTVMSGEGVYNVTGLAESLKQPLFAYSMTGSHKVFALGGTPETFVQSLQQLFQSCKVRRVAVLSEKSSVSSDVTAALHQLHNAGALTSRDELLLEASEDTINKSLNSLLDDKARIFLVNGDTLFAKNLIQVARKMYLTPERGYLWIVREWAGPGDNIMKPYELTFAYRGGANLSSNELRDLAQQLNKYRTWPQYTTPLANAILTLAIGFTTLTKSLPDAIDDVHSPDAYRRMLESSSTFPSMVGELRIEKHEVQNPRTFLYRWNDTFPVLVNKYDGCPITSPNELLLDGSITCYTSSDGKAFPPKCNDVLWLLISFASVILLFVFIITAIGCRRALRARDKRLTEEAEKMGRARLDAFTSSLAPSFVDRKALKLRYQIGTGRFGLVWFGMLQVATGGTRPIAAKALREGAVAEEQSEFFREARNLAVLQHDHVVRFVGVCVADGPPLLLMEYAFFGDLLQYLSNRRHLVESTESDSTEAQYVSAEALTRHAHDAATALAFLVRRSFVHRDVRAANCLIDDRRTLKLADFGMAREMSGTGNDNDGEYWCRRRSLFPVLWMAPESLSRGVFSTASDIWALGVLVLELITLGARPYGGRSPLSVVELVTAGGRPPLPHDVSADARDLLLRCWRRAPSERLTASAVVSFLKEKPYALRPALATDSSSVHFEVEEEVDSGIGEPPAPTSPLSVRSLSFDGNFLNDANM